MLQLAIDRNPQRLKHPRRRFFASLSTHRSWQRCIDRVDQIGNRLNRRSRPLPHDLFGNRPTESFLAVFVKNRRELFARRPHQQLGRRFARQHIEPHIERSRRAEPEPALSIRQLIRRQPQVDDNPVDRWDPQLAEHFRQVAITGVTQVTPLARNHRRRVLQHQWIAVETNQSSVRLNAFDDFSAVPTSANCAINDRQARTQIESLQCFPQQNGDMYRSQWMLQLD